MILSGHAQKQMTMRGISRASVLAVLIHGNANRTDVPHIVRHELEGLFVVEDTRSGVIVTTYHDDGGRKWKRKKHGSAKP
jgi:hypothetical protein